MILDLLKVRYSCRNFSDKQIPDDVIKYIVECGRLAPSGGNEQPWKFGIVTDKEKIIAISKAASIHYDQSWIATSPLVLVLCTQIFDCEIGMVRFPSFHEKMRSIARDLFAVIDMEEGQVKIPGEHMVLAALEHGISSTWISCVDCERVGNILGVKGYHVTNLIVFGYPAAAQAPTPKKTTENVVFTNHFENEGMQH